MPSAARIGNARTEKLRRLREVRMRSKILLSASLALSASLFSVAASSAEGPRPCSQFSELECIQSTTCKLEQVSFHGSYVCREAKNRCEAGFRQAGEGDIQKLCESTPGCKFKYADCYCPPNLNCACGGGPPAQCVEKK